ncbi:sugar-binding domain-containing protein [Lactiplantibacillus modestisalitolerans]|uniref:Sugar-binding domain-containing protein n=1 Tax=Lactiplantibacillus modestisalitolerans TaxID=1457219 RepID=A0ABV5WSY1_9LACO|nr:sugar-binding domain-containing protein [Lactiplantibacillus modestisalitolerans]
MHTKINLNQNWLFHRGELATPVLKTAKKAQAFGGLTAPMPDEAGARVPVSPGGTHFLKLISQGHVEQGLRNLAGTDLTSTVDADWQTVTLPHDWKMTQPYVNDPQNLMSGSKPDGVGYYRRTFDLPAAGYQHQRYVLHFDGVMRMADVWLNGSYLGHNNSGYTAFEFDVTAMARYGNEGTNVLLVRTDTTTGPEGWWYEGAGIYRSVWLEAQPLVALDPDRAYVYTQKINATNATMQAEVAVKNNSAAAVTVQPQLVIASQALAFETQTIAPQQTVQFEQSFQLDSPKLWSPEHPDCYTAKFKIDGDEVVKTVGIHTFDYTTTGFYLNGQPYELHGVCEHQDFAGVGIALDQDIVDYKVQQMKKMGVNAWRSTHHFAAEELLRACDRYGVIVINENRLLESTPWRLADLKRMVRKSRQHPSIGFWSIANEEVSGNTSVGSRIAKQLVQTIKQLDHEHLVISAELLTPEGKVDPEYIANLDVLGVNYPEAGVMGPGAKLIKAHYPDLPMMSTENASYFSTRGVYQDDGDQCQTNNFGSLYSMVLPGKRQPGDPGVGGTATPETVMAYLQAHPYMGGVFLWTAFDYYGEPSPFGWPGISSQFGIADLCGFPKDYYYYYQAHWTKTPMVHVMPHWNQTGLELTADGQTRVRAFSNAAEVELLVNDHSYGRKTVQDCQVNWQVPYEAGTLTVIAYQANQVVAQDQRITSGPAVKVAVERIFNGNATDLYRLTALDAANQPVATANDSVKLEILAGQFVATGNGNPANLQLSQADQVTLFNGHALVILRANSQNEPTQLRAHLQTEFVHQ